MQLQKDWKDKMAENLMKPLWVFEKRCVKFVVYILKENATLTNDSSGLRRLQFAN
jgi:hypothetical protein